MDSAANGKRCKVSQVIRYADDLVIILKPQDDATKILEKISQFLAGRGMKVSEKKTKLTATTDGFDNRRLAQQKCKATENLEVLPSVENYKKLRQKIKAIVNNSNYGSKVKAEKRFPDS